MAGPHAGAPAARAGYATPGQPTHHGPPPAVYRANLQGTFAPRRNRANADLVLELEVQFDGTYLSSYGE